MLAYGTGAEYVIPRMSLYCKLLAALIVVLLPVLGLLLVSFQADRARQEAVVVDEQLLTAQAVAVQIDQLLGSAVGAGWLMAREPMVQTMDPALLDPYLKELAELNPSYDRINVYDAQGINRGWGYSTPPPKPRTSIANRPDFQNVMATNTPEVGEVLFADESPPTLSIVAAVPIRDTTGQPVGMVEVVIDGNRLGKQFATTLRHPLHLEQVWQGEAILLADPNGRLVFHTLRPNLTIDDSNAYVDLELMQRALSGTPAQTTSFVSRFLDDSRLGTFVPTPKYGWVVGVTTPRSTALASVEQTRQRQLAAFAVILVLSAALATLLARYLIDPVRRLEHATREMGRGSLKQSVRIQTGDEMERLGASFNHMVRQLEQRQTEVLEHLSREEALARIGRALVNELDLERVADVVMEQSLKVLHADAVELWLVDPAHRELCLLASTNLTQSVVDEIRRVSYDSPLVTAQAARTGQIQAVEDIHLLGPEHKWAIDLASRLGLRSLLAVPLCSRGRLVGVVTHLAKEQRHFSPREIEFNQTVADLFAVAIENARLYNDVREALRLREEFLSAAAHELKTPVTTIKGWAEWLSRGSLHGEQERRALDAINRQSDRITRLIEDLLTVVSLRHGLPSVTRERFCLGALVSEVVARTAGTIKCVRFHVDANGSLVVDADRRRVGEAIGHLLENAVLYSPLDGSIEVEVQHMDNHAIVTVRDHGGGIPAERQRHIFEPFYEPVPTGLPGYAGIVSLGLYLSKQIIEMLDGHIWVESQAGTGTTVSFSLPLAVDKGEQFSQ